MQTQATLAQGAKSRPNAIKFAEIIFPHHEEDGERHRFEIKLFRSGGIVPERYGRAILHQIGQLADELRGATSATRGFAAEREEFLKLVESEKRSNEIVVRTPKMVVLTMEIFPERLARARARRIHLTLGCSRGDPIEHLCRKRVGALHVVESDGNGQMVFSS